MKIVQLILELTQVNIKLTLKRLAVLDAWVLSSVLFTVIVQPYDALLPFKTTPKKQIINLAIALLLK